MVGVSVAPHLRRRGWDVVLVDRQGPGEGSSFGIGGLIQREAVYPHPFPRALAELRRVARNRAVDVVHHPSALPRVSAPLPRYWWHSPERYARAVPMAPQRGS
jgi:D-amino-acid dehydrogenase